jgi:hypothetical protein
MFSKPVNISSVCSILSGCINKITAQSSSLHQQLNTNKMELICFGSHTNLDKNANQVLSLVSSSDTIIPADIVEDHNISLNSQIIMQQHVAKISAA